MAALLFPASRSGDIAPLAITVDLLLCTALIPLALALLRRSESASPPHGHDRPVDPARDADVLDH